MKSYKNFVNGQMVDAVEGLSEDIISPVDERVIGRVPKCGEKDVDRAVDAAAAAFETWQDTTPGERSLMLLKLADRIEQNAEELAVLEADNVGKPIGLARSEVPFMVDNLRFFAGACRCMEGKAAGEYLAGYTSMIRREPVGVVGSIAPWNYPLMMAVWKVGPALAAGNTVILKPSEQTPLTSLRLMELAGDIFPPGVLNVITGHGEPVGAGLVRHPRVNMVSLTGDVATGKEIARTAAASLKKVHLELGGKAPVLIFDDADMDLVIPGLKIAGFANSGQDCTAACRIYASDRVYDKFLAALVPAVQSIQVGDIKDENTRMGPVISAEHRKRVGGFLERAKASGHARVLTGGGAADGKGFWFPPTDHRGREADRRDRQEGDLRPRHHRHALQRRRRGDPLGQRRGLRPLGVGVDDEREPSAQRRPQAAVRDGLDQRPPAARLRDAARRLQAVGVRQGHVHVRARGLHAGQARHGADRADGGGELPAVVERAGALALTLSRPRGRGRS